MPKNRVQRVVIHMSDPAAAADRTACFLAQAAERMLERSQLTPAQRVSVLERLLADPPANGKPHD